MANEEYLKRVRCGILEQVEFRLKSGPGKRGLRIVRVQSHRVMQPAYGALSAV